MKFFTNLFLFLFITFAAYLLLNEKTVLTKRSQIKKISRISGSTSKIIGQRLTQDLSTFELQRQRINSEAVYKFQSLNSGESYELDDSDLDKFGVQLLDFNNLNRDINRSKSGINNLKVKRF